MALSRYLYLVSEPPLFPDAEWNLLRDVCNGWYTQSTPASVVLQELAFVVEDVLQLRALDQHWGVDASVLLARLRSFSPLETAATIHALEQWWDTQTG